MDFPQVLSSFNSEGAVLKSHDPLGNKSSVAVNGPKRAEKSIISAVIDRSSSMTAIWANTVAGFDSFLESQKETEGDAVYSLRVFDHLQTIVYSFVPADEACTIPHTVKPRFGTALNDAIGQEIRRIRNFQMENPAYTSVVLLIMTDGMENASREFNTAQVRRLVQICQREEWQIIFMGANIDAFATGGTFGFTNTIQYDGPSLNASFVTAASSARSYRQSGRSSARSVDLTMQSGQP